MKRENLDAGLGTSNSKASSLSFTCSCGIYTGMAKTDLGSGLQCCGEEDYEAASMLRRGEYHDKLDMSAMGTTTGSNRQYICHIFAALGPSHSCDSHMVLAAGTIMARTSLLYISLPPYGGTCLFSTRIQVTTLLLTSHMILGQLLHLSELQFLCQYNT